MLRISGNQGFITNSSSVVHHFPRTMLEHPRIKAFMEAYGVVDGYVGDNMWHRGECASFAVTKEQKQDIHHKLNVDTGFDFEVRGVPVSLNDDDVVLVYGDEYQSVTSELCHLFCNIAEELGIPHNGDDYN